MWSLAVHTIWQICNEWRKEPRRYALSQDEHGALTLIHRALGKNMCATLFFSSGTGLTSEEAAGYTLAMQRIMQLTQIKEFREGKEQLDQAHHLPNLSYISLSSHSGETASLLRSTFPHMS